jgi:rhamnosyltransferase
MNESISAGIVLYNPDLVILKKNIEAIIGQVAHLCLIDNASDNIEEIEALLKNYSVDLIKNSKNEGIAKALNQICNYGIIKGSSWCLTLDQDSICEKNIIECYKQCFDLANVGMISSNYLDRNREKNIDKNRESSDIDYKYDFVDFCITSGSLVNLKAFIQVGGFDEIMFIDFVDNDFCNVLRKFNWKICKLNRICFEHEIGINGYRRFLWHKVLVYKYSAIRRYYTFRNGIYLIRKYNSKGLKRYLIKTFFLLIYDDKPIKKINSAIKGIKDGLKMPINYQWKNHR